jgi:hypothetical protein
MKFTYIGHGVEGKISAVGHITVASVFSDKEDEAGILYYGYTKLSPSEHYWKAKGKLNSLIALRDRPKKIEIPSDSLNHRHIAAEMLVDIYNRERATWVRELVEAKLRRLGFDIIEDNVWM